MNKWIPVSELLSFRRIKKIAEDSRLDPAGQEFLDIFSTCFETSLNVEIKDDKGVYFVRKRENYNDFNKLIKDFQSYGIRKASQKVF